MRLLRRELLWLALALGGMGELSSPDHRSLLCVASSM